MTDEARLSRLEKEIAEFNAVVSGAGLQGGFPKLEKLDNVQERIDQIKAAHEAFGVRGGNLATVEGNLRSGLAVNFKCPPAGAQEGTVQITSTPPPPATGACCVGTECTIETEADCEEMDGDYQGDDTICDEVVCACPNCCDEGVGFLAFDGSGRRFLTRTTVYHLDYSNEGDSNCANGIDVSGDYTVVLTYGSVGCGDGSCSCLLKCTAFGHSEWLCHMASGDRTCVTDIVSTCQNPDTSDCFDWEGEIVQVDGTHVPTTTPCMQGLGYGILDGVFVVDSATQRHQGASEGATWVQTLTDECVECDGTITDISGDISASADETCSGVHKLVTASGTFTGGSAFFYIPNAYSETCDETSSTYDLEAEIDIECRTGNPDPADNGWFIHIFFSGPSTCCGETSWAYNSGIFTKYAEPSTSGTGSFSFPLSLEGGSIYGTGSGTLNVVIS